MSYGLRYGTFYNKLCFIFFEVSCWMLLVCQVSMAAEDMQSELCRMDTKHMASFPTFQIGPGIVDVSWSDRRAVHKGHSTPRLPRCILLVNLDEFSCKGQDLAILFEAVQPCLRAECIQLSQRLNEHR